APGGASKEKPAAVGPWSEGHGRRVGEPCWQAEYGPLVSRGQGPWHTGTGTPLPGRGGPVEEQGRARRRHVSGRGRRAVGGQARAVYQARRERRAARRPATLRQNA